MIQYVKKLKKNINNSSLFRKQNCFPEEMNAEAFLRLKNEFDISLMTVVGKHDMQFNSIYNTLLIID